MNRSKGDRATLTLANLPPSWDPEGPSLLSPEKANRKGKKSKNAVETSEGPSQKSTTRTAIAGELTDSLYIESIPPY